MNEYTVVLTQEEKEYLQRVLQTAIGETRVEAHRTHYSPDFRDRVLAEEVLLRGMISKLEAAATAVAH